MLEGAALRRSDGSVVDSSPLDGDGPSQVELTTVLAAGTELGGAVLTHAWTTDIRRRESDGTVVAVLTARGDDDPADDAARHDRFRPIADHRFVYTRLDAGGEWQTHALGLAGPGLLPHEQDYTGLAAIDPYDIDVVYVSTPVDPRTATATPHHEIYRGRTADLGQSWTWEAITHDSDVDNLRPIVAPGDPSRLALLWFRGSMTASQHYRCEAVMHLENR